MGLPIETAVCVPSPREFTDLFSMMLAHKEIGVLAACLASLTGYSLTSCKILCTLRLRKAKLARL